MSDHKAGPGNNFDQKKLALKQVQFHPGMSGLSYFFNFGGNDRIISYDFEADDKVKIVARETRQSTPLIELLVTADSVRARTREGQFVLKKGVPVLPETTDKRSVLLLAQNWMSGTTAPDHLLDVASGLLPAGSKLDGKISPFKIKINWDDMWEIFNKDCVPQGEKTTCTYTDTHGVDKIVEKECECGIPFCTTQFFTTIVPVIVVDQNGNITHDSESVQYSMCVCWCQELN